MPSSTACSVAIGCSLAAAFAVWRGRQHIIRSLDRLRRTAALCARASRKAEFVNRIAAQGSGTEYGYATAKTGHIDTWRAQELPNLIAPLGRESSPGAMVYMDYAGAALPTARQLEEAARDASSRVVCANPHSVGPAASTAANALEHARRLVLAHLCGNRAHEWELIWTAGTTAALRTAAEAFPFAAGRSRLMFTPNVHTSVLGMRVVAQAAGASWQCVTEEALENHELVAVASSASAASVAAAASAAATDASAARGSLPSTVHGDDLHHSLLVLPAECNLTGDRLPSRHFARAFAEQNNRSGAGERWWVLLDAAKLASTAPIDLPETGAAMCCVSLYKLFGEPTGLGALLVRSDLAALLRRGGRYFGGGSIASILADEDYQVPKTPLASALAGGTAHYRGALAVPAGFRELERLGGMRAVAAHTAVLIRELVRRLRDMRHENGNPAIALYGRVWGGLAHGTMDDEDIAASHAAGPTVAFNVRRPSGDVVGYAEVIKLASLNSPPIQLRGGCCCNPGGCQRALGLTAETVRAAAAAGKECGDEMDLLDGKPTGVVRASLGKDSIWEDVDELVEFLHTTFVARGPDDEIACFEVGRPAPQPPTLSVPRLRAVYIFPIKSCAAMSVPVWWMERASGRLLFDREWALVDGFGQVMRLSRYPNLALLCPSIDLERATLTLRYEGRHPLVLPLSERPRIGCNSTESSAVSSADRVAAEMNCTQHGRCDTSPSEVNVCGKDCAARSFGGADASRWLSEALGVHCQIVQYGLEHDQKARDAPTSDGVAFANEAPLLLLADSAVDALNHSLRANGQASVDARHFRPNLVLSGLPHGTDESSWRRVVLSADDASVDISLDVTGPCARCEMVEIDPTSGARHGSVLRALSRHHRIRSRLVFGVFCAPPPATNGTAEKPMTGYKELVEIRAGSTVSIEC